MIYHDQPKQWKIPPPRPKGAEKFSRFPNSSRRRAGIGADLRRDGVHCPAQPDCPEADGRGGCPINHTGIHRRPDRANRPRPDPVHCRPAHHRRDHAAHRAAGNPSPLSGAVPEKSRSCGLAYHSGNQNRLPRHVLPRRTGAVSPRQF